VRGDVDTPNRVYPSTGRQKSWYMVSQVIPLLRSTSTLTAAVPAAR
jgi:hypothetical protein